MITEETNRHRKHGKTILITVFYIGAGCIFYRLTEEKPCESEERLSAPEYDEELCVEPWTVIDALYFSMVTMSTVGYGDLTPTSAGSKIFTCVYIIVGIAVVFVRISEAFGGVLGGIDKLFLRFLNRWDKTPDLAGNEDGLGGEAVDLDGDGDADFVAPPSSKVYWAQGLTSGCALLAMIQFVSALIFMQLEQDLPFGDAMYHCFVTATTVGYGDVSLTRQWTRLWAFLHIALCVSFLGAVISRVGELHAARTSQLQRYQLLVKQVDEDFICSLDRDGTGVDKLEFVIGMLIQLGAQLCGSPLEWEDVEPFMQRFDAADKDKSGFLTHDDLQHMAHSKTDAKIVRQSAHHFQHHDYSYHLDREDSNHSHHSIHRSNSRGSRGHNDRHDQHDENNQRSKHDQGNTDSKGPDLQEKQQMLSLDSRIESLSAVISQGFQDLWKSIEELRKTSCALQAQVTEREQLLKSQAKVFQTSTEAPRKSSWAPQICIPDRCDRSPVADPKIIMVDEVEIAPVPEGAISPKKGAEFVELKSDDHHTIDTTAGLVTQGAAEPAVNGSAERAVEGAVGDAAQGAVQDGAAQGGAVQSINSEQSLDKLLLKATEDRALQSINSEQSLDKLLLKATEEFRALHQATEKLREKIQESV